MTNGFVRTLIYTGGFVVFVGLIYGHGGHADGHASVAPHPDSGPTHSSLPQDASDDHSFPLHLEDF